MLVWLRFCFPALCITCFRIQQPDYAFHVLYMMLQSAFRLKKTLRDHVPSFDVWLSRLISQTLKGGIAVFTGVERPQIPVSMATANRETSTCHHCGGVLNQFLLKSCWRVQKLSPWIVFLVVVTLD